MIHLDTSFLIRGFVSETLENLALRKWLGADETLAVSTVAWMEFLSGPVEPSEFEFAASIVNRHIDFTPAHAEIAARLFNLSGRRRRLFADCMIAATAIAENAPIATTNERDFRRFESEGLTFALA
ncbi:MAG: PIN domain-containing protein [Rhodospirillales bacterium]|nr:PIN domain-containing protein [Rhodospirillales bacterium]